jgi:hypothetical protein
VDNPFISNLASAEIWDFLVGMATIISSTPFCFPKNYVAKFFCSVLVGFVLSPWPTWQSLVTIWSHDIMNSWWRKRALVACPVTQSIQAVSRSSVPPFGLLAPFRFMVLAQPTSSSTAPHLDLGWSYPLPILTMFTIHEGWGQY